MSVATVQGSDGGNLPHVQPVGGSVAGSPFAIPALSGVPDAEWGTPSGQVVTITSAGSNLPAIPAGGVFEVGSHNNPDNNGLYQESGGSPTTASVTATKLSGTPSAAPAELIIFTPIVQTPKLTGLLMIHADRPIHAVFSKSVTGATDNDMVLPANQIHKFPVDGHTAYFKEAIGATTVHVSLARTVEP